MKGIASGTPVAMAVPVLSHWLLVTTAKVAAIANASLWACQKMVRRSFSRLPCPHDGFYFYSSTSTILCSFCSYWNQISIIFCQISYICILDFAHSLSGPPLATFLFIWILFIFHTKGHHEFKGWLGVNKKYIILRSYSSVEKQNLWIKVAMILTNLYQEELIIHLTLKEVE